MFSFFLRPITFYLLTGLACLSLPHFAFAQFSNYPGGIVDLTIDKEGSELPDVKYGLNDVAIFDRKDHWQVLIGIDQNTLPGDYLLYVKHANDDKSAFHQKFTVAQKEPIFTNPLKTNFDLNSLRHERFSDLNFNNTVEPALPLNYPLAGQWTDQFGALEISEEDDDIRVRNYISLSTTQLTTVLAPQNGIVSRVIENTDNQVSEGINITSSNTQSGPTSYTLFLDHGRGLYSILSGVMDITIEPGNGVLAGAVLGKIYTRDTSNNEPHTLFWQTILNEAYVNPVILTQFR